jgi:hypothetical protein
MRHRLAVACLCAAASVALTACTDLTGGGAAAGSGGTGLAGGSTSAATSGDAEVVTWIDKVCGKSLDVIKALAAEPELDTTNPAKMQQQFGSWLGEGSTAIQKTIDDLGALKNGPHRDSAAFVDGTTKIFGAYKTSIDDLKKKVESANAADPQSVATVFGEVGADLQKLGKNGADVAGISVTPSLAEAKKKAPNCRAIGDGVEDAAQPTG